MPEFFSSDGSLPLQFLVIFGVILVAMLAVYALFRRFFDRGSSVPVRGGSRSRQPRLGIVDIYELDQRRQLILLRRDNVEHLLLVGGPNDVVVERNVQRVAGSRLPADTMIRPEPASDMPFLPGQDDREEVSSLAPPFAMPVVMPPPLPEPEEAQGPRLDPPLFEPKLDAQDKAPRTEPAPVLAASPAPTRRERVNPPRREAPPVDEPWREAAAERAATTAPEPTVQAAPTAPAAEVRPAGSSAISSMARQFETVLRKQPAPSARPAPAAKVEPAPPVSLPALPPVLPPADATPAPAVAPPPEPAPEPTLPRVAEAPVLVSAPEAQTPAPKREPAIDPVAAGMSSAPDPLPEPKPEQKPEPAAPPIQPAPSVQPAAAIRPAPEPDRSSPEPLRPAPPARPAVQPIARIQERNVDRLAERPREQPFERPADRPVDRPLQRPEPNVVAVKPVRPAPPPPEDKPAPETRRGANPFSVEEIEAEFARLLGRPLSRRD